MTSNEFSHVITKSGRGNNFFLNWVSKSLSEPFSLEKVLSNKKGSTRNVFSEKLYSSKVIDYFILVMTEKISPAFYFTDWIDNKACSVKSLQRSVAELENYEFIIRFQLPYKAQSSFQLRFYNEETNRWRGSGRVFPREERGRSLETSTLRSFTRSLTGFWRYSASF